MTAIFENLGRQSPLLLAAMGLFPLAAGAYGLTAIKKGGAVMRTLAPALFILAFLAATAVLVLRWIEAGRPPFKTLYESLLLFVWCTALLYIIVERFYRIAWFGFLTSGTIVLTYAYALMKADAEIVNLPAALQSPWFIPHVVVYFIGYAALFFAFLAAIMHLFRPNAVLVLRANAGQTVEVTYAGFMHKVIQLAFVLLTAGLVIGAIWAKSAWGDYWMWDPKESWALVSWLMFVIYLHLYHTKSFSERGAAILTIVGFAGIVFTYLGMHLLPTAEQSNHLYQ